MKITKMKKLNISGSIQRKTLIRSTLESLEDVQKHAAIRSGAPLKCLSEFSKCFPVVNKLRRTLRNFLPTNYISIYSLLTGINLLA